MEEKPVIDNTEVSGAPTTNETPEPKTKSSKAGSLLVAGVSVAVVVGVIIWYVVGIQSVRALSESPFAVTTARIFRIPVASMNGEKIQYTKYVDKLRAMKTFYNTEAEGTPRPTDAEMSDYIISRLLINHLVDQVAKEYKTALTQEDIDTIVNTKLLVSFESREKAEEEIMKRYGWTLDEFVQKIVAPTELEQKLSNAYLEATKDPAKKEAVRTQAQTVLDRIKKGESFEKLAKEFGSDSTAESGVDLGGRRIIKKVPEFEAAAFALKKGELAENLVESQFGYHIIKKTDQRVTKDQNGDEVEEIKASHILFKTDDQDTSKFATYMNQRLLSSEIKVSKGLRNPFEEMGNSAEVLETEPAPSASTTEQ